MHRDAGERSGDDSERERDFERRLDRQVTDDIVDE